LEKVEIEGLDIVYVQRDTGEKDQFVAVIRRFVDLNELLSCFVEKTCF